MTDNLVAQCRPVPLAAVTVEGGFWGRVMETNSRVTLPIEYKQCHDTGRIDAFKLEWKSGQPNPPHIFWDSDVGKWIEAAAYSLAARPDAELEHLIDGVIDLIANSQQPDGYLNTHFTVVEPGQRWTNLRDRHELYCAGHLIEAAVAYYQATGKRRFLNMMRRYADHIDATFGPRENQKHGYSGHEEIELALVKLYRATDEPRYLDLARYFIDERGQPPHYFDAEARARGEDPGQFRFKTYEYNQSHVPVREQTEVVGHAVRAMYLYSGMTDVATATGDRTLLDACKRLWKNLTLKRMHVTGGLGPVESNEGFTTDYDLPNESGYLETCAAVGLVFWAHRMLNADLDGQYADVMECALYNGTLSGVSLDGETFFYGNPLASYPGFDGDGRFVRQGYFYRRSEWFDCACCPPNLARMVGQFPGYLYSTGQDEICVHQYASGTAAINVAEQTVQIIQKTAYPWKERITLIVKPEQASTWTLALRIPGWCRGAQLAVNGKTIRVPPITRRGYARIRHTWEKGDRVELVLPMPVERIEAHPSVRQDCGRIALQRGPLVYCLEEADNGPGLNDIVLPRNVKFVVRNDKTVFGGTPVLITKGVRHSLKGWQAALYRPAGSKMKTVSVKAIPYFMWANRQPGEMMVWIREG